MSGKGEYIMYGVGVLLLVSIVSIAAVAIGTISGDTNSTVEELQTVNQTLTESSEYAQLNLLRTNTI